MLELQILPSMCTEIQPMVISTTAEWLEFFFILLSSTLLMLSIVLHDRFCPRLLHKHALKQNSHSVIATADKGLIMKPSKKLLKNDSFPDADFAGMYGHKAMDDLVCDKSRTGYVIMVANCPIMWQSKLQSKQLYLQWKLKLFP